MWTSARRHDDTREQCSRPLSTKNSKAKRRCYDLLSIKKQEWNGV